MLLPFSRNFKRGSAKREICYKGDHEVSVAQEYSADKHKTWGAEPESKKKKKSNWFFC